MRNKPMNLINIRKFFLPFLLVIFTSITSFAQQSLWVGQSYTLDVSSSVMGITTNVSWSTNGGYLSLSGSGFYRTITVTKYFSGTATVTCEWDYRLTGSGSYTHTKRQVTITCKDNPISISPTSLSLSSGETRYINYSHQYSNAYTSAADVTFQSSNTSVCTVNSAGAVVAKNPGTAYINVYSKNSSVSPSCKVTVTKIDPTSVEIPSNLNLVRGDQVKLTPTLTPSNASTNYTWSSSNANIANVSSSGVITGVAKGNAVVSVTTGNGLTSQCSVAVDNPQLEISCSHESGIVKRGCEIYLNSTDKNAKIYYTLDDTTPTAQSIPYTNSIVIENYTTLKAVAFCEGYYQSDVLERNFEVSTLELIETNAISGGVVTDNVLYFKFNEPIQKGPLFVPQSRFMTGMYISIKLYGLPKEDGGRPGYSGVAVIEDNMLKIYCNTEDRTVVDLYIKSGFIQSQNGEQFEDININNLLINDYLNQDNVDLESFKFASENMTVMQGEVFIPHFDFTPVSSKYSTCKLSISNDTVISKYWTTDRSFFTKKEGECEIIAELTLSNGNVLTDTVHITVLDPNASINDVFIDSYIEKSVMVYTLQGNLIYFGSMESIPPLKPSIYIFKIGKDIRKVIVKSEQSK